jgi:nucleoside-diphosphate-sugar epimerase
VRVFLTGGTGFIGGEVARRLRARGDDVRALVRDPARAGALRELGCDLVQGFHLGRPMPPAELTARLRRLRAARAPAA